MPMQNYSRVSIIIHWLMAILILGMFVLGGYMEDLPKGSAERTYFFSLHKSIGLTLALLALFRLFWKLYEKPPELPEFVIGWKRKLANAAHHSLYLFMFIQPLTGYLSSSFSGYKTKFWGIPLPHWGWKDKQLNEFFTELHDISATILMLLIVVHVLGVVYHIHRGEKQILKRMLSFSKQE